MQGHELGGSAQFVLDQHAMREPDFFGIAAEYYGFDVHAGGRAHVVQVAQVRLDGINGATGCVEVLAAYAEVVLHDPGGITEGHKVVGLVQVSVEIEPAVLQRLAVKPENRHCSLRY